VWGKHIHESLNQTYAVTHAICGLCVPRKVEGALQPLSKPSRAIRFAHAHERVSTKCFVVLIFGNSRVESLRRTGHV